MKKFFPLLLTLVALASCSKRTELLDTIPARVPAVAMADMNLICSDLGVKLTPEGAEIPASLGNNDDLSAILDLMGRLHAASAADISETAVFATEDGDAVITLAITDKSRFESVDCSWLIWGKDSDGLRIGTLGESFAAVASDSQLWLLTDLKTPSKTVKKLLDKASKESVGKVDALAQALSRGGLLQAVVCGAKDDKTPIAEVPFTTIALKSEDAKLSADIAMMLGTGEETPVAGLQPINSAVLGYVPAEMDNVIAFGANSTFDWSWITTLATLGGGFQAQAAISAILPYLKSIDGTVLFALTAPETEDFSDMDFSQGNAMLMARMSQDKINELLGMIRTMMFTAGLSPRTEGGMMVIPQYGTTLYVGNVDGYLGISTVPFSPNRQNALAPLMANKDAAVTFTLPALSLSGHATPLPLRIEGTFGGATGHITLTIPGTTTSPLATLLGLL